MTDISLRLSLLFETPSIFLHREFDGHKTIEHEAFYQYLYEKRIVKNLAD